MVSRRKKYLHTSLVILREELTNITILVTLRRHSLNNIVLHQFYLMVNRDV